MADQPVKKNAALTLFIPGLVSQSNTKTFQTNPTIAAGDFKISKDGGAFVNLATLPDVEPDGGTQVRVQLSADEMNADQITLKFQDAAGAEWCDGSLMIFTASAQMGDLNTSLNTLLTRIPATLFSGITSLAQWLGMLAGKQAGNSTARAELRATGAGSGTYDETTDSLEALRDKGMTLTYNEMQSIADAAAGIDISIMRHVDYAKTFGSLSISASWTKMYLTLKRTKEESDASAQLQVVVTNPAAGGTDGVLYVNSAAASASQRTQGSLTVNQGAGTVAVALNDELTAIMNDTSKGNWVYDIKQVTSVGTSLLSRGLVAVTDAVTRAQS